MTNLINGKKVHKIEICTRINLYFSNAGFRFYHSGTPLKEIAETAFYDWERWQYHYPPYLRDDLKQKIFNYLSSLPERSKCETFYQSIRFN